LLQKEYYLFYIEKDSNTITFNNSISEEDELEASEYQYTTATKEDLTITLESKRGHCPKPKTTIIGDIINSEDTRNL
jgi:hypothetical protein